MLKGFATSTALAAACLQALACAPDRQEVAQGDTAGATSAAAAAPSGGLTESNVVALLDGVNVADSTAGDLASQKGTSAQVKEFGRMMMRDHHTLRQQQQELAQRLGVTPQTPAGDTTHVHLQKVLDSLKAMPKSPAWDQHYIASEVAAHDAAVRLLQQAQGTVQNADLRAFIEKAIPNVQGHLERAREIQRSLGGTSAGGSDKADSAKRG